MPSDLTRRGALALLGGLAGCSGLSPLSSDADAVELDGAALRETVADAPPSIPHRLPAELGADHLDATERRGRALLDSVPADLGPEEIPNGAIRERVRDARTHAADGLSRAAEATTRFERLTAFADARTDTRFAAAAWRAVSEGLARGDLRDEAAAIRGDRRTLRDRWSYVGDDPVDATLVHAAVERRLDAARSNAAVDGRRHYRDGNPLGVGEVAEDLERARAAVDDAAHVYDRLTAALDDPADLRSRLVEARTALRDDFEAARADLPSNDDDHPWRPADADVEDTPADGALRDLYRPIKPDSGRGRGARDDALARSLLGLHGSFVDLRAFESLRARVADGERFAVESVDDVAAVRTDAVEAIRAVDAEPGVPGLTRSILADLADHLARLDGELARDRDAVQAAALRREVSEYLAVAARARATPSASERVGAALQG